MGYSILRWYPKIFSENFSNIVRELCFDVPQERLLLCSDSPRTPASIVGAAGVPSLPCHTPLVAEAVALQQKVPVEHVSGKGVCRLLRAKLIFTNLLVLWDGNTHASS